jgi:hypothetical protein
MSWRVEEVKPWNNAYDQALAAGMTGAEAEKVACAQVCADTPWEIGADGQPRPKKKEEQ